MVYGIWGVFSHHLVLVRRHFLAFPERRLFLRQLSIRTFNMKDRRPANGIRMDNGQYPSTIYIGLL